MPISLNHTNILTKTNSEYNIIIILGCSGVGKGSTIRRLVQQGDKYTGQESKYFDPRIKPIISCTTRLPRPGEIHGVHYNFISIDEFMSMVDLGMFAEFAEFSGNFYGTPKLDLTEFKRENRIPLLEIELNGLLNLMQRKDLKPLVFFITPDSHVLEELAPNLENEVESRLKFKTRELSIEQQLEIIKNRLCGRKDTSEEAMLKRSKQAIIEMCAWSDPKKLISAEIKKLIGEVDPELMQKLLELGPLNRLKDFTIIPSITSNMEYAASLIHRIIRMKFPESKEILKEQKLTDRKLILR